MKRMLKLILVLVSIAVLGCSSSKDVVNIPGATVPDDSISVKFDIDRTSYSDMTADSYVQVTLKADDPSIDPLIIALNQRYSLKRDSTYVVTGYYINTGNIAVAFPNDSFSLRVYGNDIKSMTVIRHQSRLIQIVD